VGSCIVWSITIPGGRRGIAVYCDGRSKVRSDSSNVSNGFQQLFQPCWQHIILCRHPVNYVPGTDGRPVYDYPYLPA
jgi:hypothetical protein